MFERTGQMLDLAENSVLKNWVMALPRREQGVLLSAMRGCDLTPKPYYPADSGPERELVAYLRWVVLNPADNREVDIPGAFMRSKPPENWKPSQFGHYPLHWFAHLMHAFQVVSVRHPEVEHQSYASDIYTRMVGSLHLNEELSHQMITRLSEDRFEAGTVVS